MSESITAADSHHVHHALLAGFDAGRRAALSRAISIVENERPGFDALLHALHPRLGRAHRIGVTGPPGAGKSTLTAALIAHYRARDERVAVVAVDPTSPFTGGALLGDRIRMNELSMDPAVFVRSMATRGSFGGLALATQDVVDVLDAYGFDRILIETVGVGQSELDVAAAADTTVVLVVPESGDAIQAMKAGLMEAAELFVVNKADRPGADRMVRELGMMLQLRFRTANGGSLYRNAPAHHGVDLTRVRAASKRAEAGAAGPAGERGEHDATGDDGAWKIPVLKTVAEKGEGVGDLAAALDAHRTWLDASGERRVRRERRLTERVRAEVDRSLRRLVWRLGDGEARLTAAASDLADGVVSPYEVAARIVEANVVATGEER
jgi:LAO/AO transport system kinase